MKLPCLGAPLQTDTVARTTKGWTFCIRRHAEKLGNGPWPIMRTVRKASLIHLSGVVGASVLLACVGAGWGGEQTRGKVGFETKSLGSGPSLLTGEPICDRRIITFDLRKSFKP